MNVSTSKDSLHNSSRSVFFCPSSPQFIWDLKHTISLQFAIAVTAAACPFTILLNILVIVAVKKIRELQTDCFQRYSDPKCAIRKIGHHARLGDINGSSYSLIPWPVHATFRRNRKHSFEVNLACEQALSRDSLLAAEAKIVVEITK